MADAAAMLGQHLRPDPPADLAAYGEARHAPSRPLAWRPGRQGLRALGLAATGLALAGVFLPILPTTPFLLVAAWAFARSSPRLDAWLRAHPRLGPMIAAWEARGAVPRSAKGLAVIGTASSLGAMTALRVAPPLLAIAAVLMTAVVAWLLSRPS